MLTIMDVAKRPCMNKTPAQRKDKIKQRHFRTGTQLLEISKAQPTSTLKGSQILETCNPECSTQWIKVTTPRNLLILPFLNEFKRNLNVQRWTLTIMDVAKRPCEEDTANSSHGGEDSCDTSTGDGVFPHHLPTGNPERLPQRHCFYVTLLH